jgi:hypothetical protein
MEFRIAGGSPNTNGWATLKGREVGMAESLHREFTSQLEQAANCMNDSTQMLLVELHRHQEIPGREEVSDEARSILAESGVIESLRRLRRLARVYR